MPAAPPLLETPESWHTNGHNAEASNGLSALPLPTPHASMPPPRFDQGRSSRISRQAFLMLSCIGREVLKELEPQMLQLKDPLRPTSVLPHTVLRAKNIPRGTLLCCPGTAIAPQGPELPLHPLKLSTMTSVCVHALMVPSLHDDRGLHVSETETQHWQVGARAWRSGPAESARQQMGQHGC